MLPQATPAREPGLAPLARIAAQRAIHLALVAAAALLPFFGALQAGFLDWDDDLNIVRNGRFRGFGAAQLEWMFGSSHGGHYHPLTWLSLALDHACWGLDPFGYHLTNLVLHTLNALLFAGLLREVLRHDRGAQVADSTRGRWLAAFGAMLFAAHPLRVESVVWVTERRDVLSAAFWIATVWVYLWACRPEAATTRRRRLVVAAILFVLSLASKAWGITLPIALLLLDVWPLRRREPFTRLVLEKLPFLLLAAGFAVAAASAQQTAGAVMSLASHGLVERGFQAAFGLCLYLRNSIAPFDLSPLYPLQSVIDPATPRFLVPAVLVVASLFALLVARRRATGVVIGCAIVLVVAAPVLGFLQSGGQLAADRYTYLACLPLPAMVVVWLARRPVRDRVAIPTAVAWVLTLGILAGSYTRHWQNSERLWDRVLALYPDSVDANLHRGIARVETGDLEAALAAFQRACDAAPRYERPRYELGRILYRQNRFAPARAALAEAVALGATDVSRPYMLAIASMQLGRFGDVLSACASARALDPAYPHTYFVQSQAQEQLGRRADAIESLETLLRLDVRYPGARDRLAQLRK